ncbi:MAG: methionine gamma-lyase family protein [Acidaminococcales bacterium]|nr:methionine gamma-lyase family protein [Acidaminococcales bacterium]
MDLEKLDRQIRDGLSETFAGQEKKSIANTRKILREFKKNRVSAHCFHPAGGYGYSDLGRDLLDNIYAGVFGAQKAIARAQFVSGTHALSTVLFGVLRPGDEMLSVTGDPYDTLRTVIGARVPQKGSLAEHGIIYRQVDFKENGEVDFEQIKRAVGAKTKIAHIQRSCGYSLRKTLLVEEIGRICETVKKAKPDCICFVDNCYGEFVEETEPTEAGADIMAGSLIKNPGGGLAPSGGYIAGREELVEMAGYHYTAPGLGSAMGSVGGDAQKLLYQGLFLAPHITLQALKTAVYAAALFSRLGYDVSPGERAARGDIIQRISLKTRAALIAFCQAVQENSPVDSYVLPMPGRMPGYQDDVIMAAGTFVQGASIELSADGPLRPPYTVYFQGGLTFEHGVLALLACAKNIAES